MSETAEGTGAAGPVHALTGPAMSAGQEGAAALAEVAATRDTLARMKVKAQRAERAAEELAETAEAGVAAAGEAAGEAMDRAVELLGGDPEQIAELADAVAAEHARHVAAIDGLVAGLGEGG